MFGHRSFLRIGSLDDASIKGLLASGMELNSFSYSYNQAIDIRGKAQGEVRSGTLLLTFANLPPDEIIDWMLNPRKYKDGSIVLCDMNDTPLQKISFENAACVGMDISYLESGNSYASTRITLRAKKMTVGNTVVENNWKNI
ncbi:hypothetical protein TFKS16_2912 [Tannerella forsythia KS16]|jgi:hypothetical protein|uniref:Type VI secretion system needle protein Hcp n=2 Tax=Tannerella forsythia TaxID=28112 RepID=G8UI63_TANFA|nr:MULTISPECIES: type VI secretion system tube protein TssD [Bacteroidales]AEW19813.1 hypothetical protein BFO_3228 [Tannerella forsythia 92A2]PDP40929.1 type VI secretion system needle protein Hcp [Porphyromonas gingivalis]PDP43290.1 type VI secretion system needle protein Hcp [Tannerella forsythia]PDP45375.1 type VI secretion system needle protein Hcp [Porphyromonas gingivalis]BAR53074.1 hypothetical protein TFKS16_2912 [Tannerella forsythia KS16]